MGADHHGVLQCAEAGRFATPTAPRPASARFALGIQDSSSVMGPVRSSPQVIVTSPVSRFCS
jgi:hypothetical protein